VRKHGTQMSDVQRQHGLRRIQTVTRSVARSSGCYSKRVYRNYWTNTV